MIKEWIQYLSSDAPAWARERGLIYESIALQSRHRRLGEAWAPHIENSKKIIREFLSQNKSAKTIMVMGSGPLLDFPRDVVDERTNLNLILVDAVHPANAKKWANRHQFKMVNADLSTSTAVVRDSLAPWIEEVDAVISLNLLSQLPLSRLGQNEEAAKCSEDHLQLLASFGKPTLLISDFLRISKDKEGRKISSEATIPRMGNPSQKWTWSLAPLGEISRQFSVELEVGVWHQSEILMARKLFLSEMAKLQFI